MNTDRIGDDPLPFRGRCIEGDASLLVCTLGADGAIAVEERMTRHAVAAAPSKCSTPTVRMTRSWRAFSMRRSQGRRCPRRCRRGHGTRHPCSRRGTCARASTR